MTKIKPYFNNPRKNAKAVQVVAKSIKKFGFRQPVVVDSGYVIIAGHTRYLAALSLGIAQIPVHVAYDLSDEDVQAYRIADNKSHEFAEWDFDKLAIEFEQSSDLMNKWWDFDDVKFEDDMNEAEILPVRGTAEIYSKSNLPSDAARDNQKSKAVLPNTSEPSSTKPTTTTKTSAVTLAATPIEVLIFKNIRIPLTEDEINKLTKSLDKHQEETGTYFGFASRLFSGGFSDV